MSVAPAVSPVSAMPGSVDGQGTVIRVDVSQGMHPISPLIYGMNQAPNEIRDKYIEYASAVRAVAPQAQLLGPVSCCWHYYWNSAAGAPDKAKHSGQDFLPWFLDEVQRHD
jgi:hypothetical protein